MTNFKSIEELLRMLTLRCQQRIDKGSKKIKTY